MDHNSIQWYTKMTNFETTLTGIILLYLDHCFEKIVFLTKLLFVKLLLAKLNLAKLEGNNSSRKCNRQNAHELLWGIV